MTQCTEKHKPTCLSPAVIMWLVFCLHQLACTVQSVSGRRRQAHRCTLRQKWQTSGQTSANKRLVVHLSRRSMFAWLTSVTLLRWWSVGAWLLCCVCASVCMRCVTMVTRVTACHCYVVTVITSELHCGTCQFSSSKLQCLHSICVCFSTLGSVLACNFMR